MDVEQMIASARDAITVKRVYGDPHEADGVTVIPAAAVGGGGGGGSGEGPEGEGSGGGGGFGVGARPAGALVVKDGEVTWVPTPDVTRIALQALIAIAALALLATVRRR